MTVTFSDTRSTPARNGCCAASTAAVPMAAMAASRNFTRVPLLGCLDRRASNSDVRAFRRNFYVLRRNERLRACVGHEILMRELVAYLLEPHAHCAGRQYVVVASARAFRAVRVDERALASFVAEDVGWRWPDHHDVKCRASIVERAHHL